MRSGKSFHMIIVDAMLSCVWNTDASKVQCDGKLVFGSFLPFFAPSTIVLEIWKLWFLFAPIVPAVRIWILFLLSFVFWDDFSDWVDIFKWAYSAISQLVDRTGQNENAESKSEILFKFLQNMMPNFGLPMVCICFFIRILTLWLGFRMFININFSILHFSCVRSRIISDYKNHAGV